MEITTDNELIAEFMGAVRSQDYGICGWRIYYLNTNDPNPTDEREMMYGKSWDWLMPVLVRWDALLIPNDKQEYFRRSQLLEDAVTNNYDITEAYEQLVDNLKWYNDNKWVYNHGK